MKIFSFFSKKTLIYSGFGAVLLIVIIIIGLSRGGSKQTITITRADIIQEVAITGKAKPNQSVNLGFDESGRVANVYAQVGDMVKRGQIIATLESGEISANLAKARASLEEENITLRETKNTSPISYNDAYKNLDAAIKGGFADADDAIRNKADQFFKNSVTNPQFEISITSGNFVHYFDVSSSIALDLNNTRKEIETILVNWQKRTLNLNQSNIATEVDASINDLNTISDFLDRVAAAVNTFISVSYTYDTTVSNYKTAISSARSEVSDAISSIVTAKDKLNTAPTLGAGGQFEDVLTQEAKVSQAEAAVFSLEASLNKSVVRAPFDGIITLQDAKVGSAISPGTTLVSLISQNDMYIEANVSEIHIGKIMVGNLVSITFDAFPDEEFLGEVSYIEPGDILVDGVVNYKIRVNLKNPDPRIKSGLTANLKIQTSKKENVLIIPLYAVINENNQTFVNKIAGGNVQKIPIKLGISGNNGFAEIMNGLGEGDIVQY